MGNLYQDKIQEAYKAMSLLNQEAYKDRFLISNQVLSKNPFNNNFLNRYLRNEKPKGHPRYTIICKLISYYCKSLIYFITYLLKFIEYHLSFFRFYHSENIRELILIDSFFIMEKIKNSKAFTDSFFLGLESFLKKFAKHYAYLPLFYSSYNNKMLWELYGILKILKKNKVPLICEYQLLSIYDYFYLLYFIITYPFHVLSFSKTLGQDSYAASLLKHELIDTLEQVTFYNFSRYLQGRQIARLSYDRIKVISWYENQPIHKNLYKGLRTNADKVKIYGAQLFLYSKNNLSLLPDENEAGFGIVPDKTITNGPYYIPLKTRLKYAVGPSLRYKKIFDTKIKKGNQKNILVLLPYYRNDTENILRLLNNIDTSSLNIFLKLHPGIPLRKYKGIIPRNVAVVDTDIYELFETAKIVIGAASGTLIESVALGIPVITIKNTQCFAYDNPLLDDGKGIIWEEVTTPEELIYQIKEFEQMLDNDRFEIGAIADRYKKLFFCEVNEDNIIKAFDL